MKKVFFAALVLFLAIAQPAAVADLLSVPSSYPTIQAAIDASSNGDFVRVGIGTYNEVVGFYDVDFKGKAITLFSAQGTSASCTIICPPGSRGFYFHSGENVNSLVWGFTIEGGDVTSDPNAYGGGIWCDSNSSPELRDVVIKNSSAKYGGGIACTGSSSPLITNSSSITNNNAIYGGGIYCENSSPTITDCNINANTATGIALDPNAYGGGIYCISSSPVFNNCQVNNNTVFGNTLNGGLSYGGGIYCENSSPNITKCQINGNFIGDYTYPGFGGGIYCRNASPTITDCNIIGNTSDGHWGGVGTESYGGGIDCSYFSSPTIKNNTIADNTSTHGGGINCFYSSSPEITGCTISGNLALTGEGGGILMEQDCNSIISNCTLKGNWGDSYGGGIDCLFSSSPLISNCIIVGNTTWLNGGGGLNCYQSSPTIVNSTIAYNAAAEVDSAGGGVYIEDINSSPVFTSTILWGNTDEDTAGTTESAQMYVFSGTPDVNYTCIQGLSSFAGNNNIGGNPLFVLDPNDGGDGWADNPDTGPDEGANDNYGDLHIQSNSPCIQAGDPNFVAGPNDTDIDGQLRVMGNRVDIGADEFFYSEGDFNFDYAVDGDDLEFFAAHWQDSGCDGSAGNYTDWCYGTDLNQSGGVEFADYAKFAINWLTVFGG